MQYRTIAAAGVVASLLATALAGPALAATDSVNMTIQARVPGVCRVANPTVLDFSDVDVLGAATDSSATFEWRCTRGTSASIEIDDGTSGTPGSRAMSSATAGEDLAYDLYQDSSRGTRWGTGTEGVDVVGTGMASPLPVTVYGRVESSDAEAAAPADDYTDQVTISVTW